MTEIDPITGLPKELGIFEDISRESQEITVSLVSRRFGKKYTVIEGVDSKGINIKDITKSLKHKFACGGSCKDGQIELQGDCRSGVKKALGELGFPPENIKVK